MDSLHRRDLLKLLAAVGGYTFGAKRLYALSAGDRLASPNSSSPSSRENRKTVFKNRAPLAPNAFYQLPLGSVRPAGWLRRQLEIQATGLGGHLDETWADVGPNSGWLGGPGES